MQDKEVPPPKKAELATLEDSKKIEEMINARGMTVQQFQVLRNVIHPEAKSPQTVLLAWDYCQAKKIDPMTKAVHIVPVYSKAAGGTVERIWLGIPALRILAHRTGSFGGADEVQFGPESTKVFKGGKGEETVAFPEWAQMTVYRFVNGVKCAFPGPKVRWLEEYATESYQSEVPNSMWKSRPYGQIEKCAEAAALRRAFPEETDVSAEEMEGKSLDDTIPATKKEQMAMRSELAQTIANQNSTAAVAEETVDAEVIESAPDSSAPAESAQVKPTIQEKMQAAARVAEATGASEAVVEALAEAGKPGITNDQVTKLMRVGKTNGWIPASIIKFVAEKFGLEAKKWQSQLTDRQYQELLAYLEANKPA